jgi:hypothetical protein
MSRSLTEREAAALRRADFDPDEIAEVAAAVAAGHVIVHVDPSGDARLVRRDADAFDPADESEERTP